MLATIVFPAGLATVVASPEGVAAARGVLYLFAAISFWALILAVRQVSKVVTTLLRALLVLIAITALGAVAVAIIAQVALALGPH
ncbi:hypothetical protein [Nonomuraea sp. NPDC048916]|uniref:hypothetical protein n=1 Tax=Nonomuraea sp. NPDC048916 TaxID=3154232 RepID=UPI00341043E9